MTRRPAPHQTGPAPGAGIDRNPREASLLAARTAIVVTVILGQLWGIAAALDAWFEGRTAAVWWIIAFQALSFGVAILVGVLPQRRR